MMIKIDVIAAQVRRFKESYVDMFIGMPGTVDERQGLTRAISS